jgi:hypothetical protein
MQRREDEMNAVDALSESVEAITKAETKARRRHHAATAHSAIIALAQELTRLRAALKPFAAISRVYLEEMGAARKSDDTRLFGANDAHFTVGDCRAALKALEGEMTTKMEEAKFSGLWQRAIHGAGDAQDARELATEAFRARASEAQLTYLAGTVEVLQKAEAEKDAQIKALVDALEIVSKSGVDSAWIDDTTGKRIRMQREVDVALRLAGRIK